LLRKSSRLDEIVFIALFRELLSAAHVTKIATMRATAVMAT